MCQDRSRSGCRGPDALWPTRRRPCSPGPWGGPWKVPAGRPIPVCSPASVGGSLVHVLASAGRPMVARYHPPLRCHGLQLPSHMWLVRLNCMKSPSPQLKRGPVSAISPASCAAPRLSCGIGVRPAGPALRGAWKPWLSLGRGVEPELTYRVHRPMLGHFSPCTGLPCTVLYMTLNGC